MSKDKPTASEEFQKVVIDDIVKCLKLDSRFIFAYPRRTGMNTILRKARQMNNTHLLFPSSAFREAMKKIGRNE